MNSSKRNSPLEQAVNGIVTDLPEVYTHPFIVKVWLEETVEEAGRAVWRGHVTHVPSGERRYVKDLDDITAFIAPYLEEMGVKLGLFWRIKRWLCKSKSDLRLG
jgi:hypothetical protein